MKLWRAADLVQPWFGPRSYWTTDEDHADHYTFMQHFGGSGLYTLDLEPNTTRVLDLRVDGWTVLHKETGIDERDYDDGILGHDLIQDLAQVLRSRFDWVAHVAFGGDRREPRPASPDEWLYLGEDPLEPVFVRAAMSH